ncbi:polycystic kidney disease 1-related protein isoform X2 [Nematostella vectensis]|uniref:polycystic kidney disease 1-related protein isoform X2 n=1 Tax=Nematostella vectensis TaxID=45351 RepID=UPI00207765BC|nr:polycystic kidney disease 1-related protein isoform X2 [Nematostella vectensis]
MALACSWGLLFAVLSVQLGLAVSRGSFYQGCFPRTATIDWVETDPVGFEKHFGCVSSCARQGYDYAAFQSHDEGCLCGSDLVLGSGISPSACETRCLSGIECSTQENSSVYSTAVPIIESLVLTPHFERIPANTFAEFEASVTVNRSGNFFDLDSVVLRNQTLANVQFDWKINHQVKKTSFEFLNGTHLHVLFNVTVKPGNFSICLEVSNFVSKSERCAILEALSCVEDLHLVDVLPGNKNPALDEQVQVKVSVESGSKVTFYWDFGDGNGEKSIGATSQLYICSPSCLTIQHRYKDCGNYSLSLTAKNDISLQRLAPLAFIVDDETITLPKYSFPNPKYKVYGLPNKDMVLSVDPAIGCNLYYNWSLGDGGPDITTTGPNITYRYQNISKYTITVVVYNQFFNKPYPRNILVYIEPLLTGVNLTISGKHEPYVLSTMTTYTFKAHVSPQHGSKDAKNYIWHLKKGDEEKIISGSENTKHILIHNPGSYLVSVEVVNGVSNVTSPPFFVCVQHPVGRVILEHDRLVQLDEAVQYSADIEEGSDFLLNWDFGDQQRITTTNTTKISHTYRRTGKYLVRLMVYNKINHVNASMTVFVSRLSSCNLQVQISGERELQVFRSSKLYLEALVQLECIEHHKLLYNWTVTSGNGNQINTRGLNTTEPTLIIPPSFLPYGENQFLVKVTLLGEVLEATDIKKVRVEPHGIVAVIKGGTMRVIGYRSRGNITLDGSDSYDPDYPDHSHQLSYEWLVQPMNGNNNNNPLYNIPPEALRTSQLTFPASEVLPNLEALNITLTVSKRMRQQKSKHAVQMIRMVDSEPYLLSIECPQCVNGLVNPNDVLVLRGSCLTCPKDIKDVFFEWSLYLVKEEATLPQTPECYSELPTKATNSLTRGTERPRTTFPETGITMRPTPGPVSGFPGSLPTTGPGISGATVQRGDVCNSKIDSPTVPPTRCAFMSRFNDFRSLDCTNAPVTGGTNNPVVTPGSGWGSAMGLTTGHISSGSGVNFPTQPVNPDPSTRDPDTSPSSSTRTSSTPQPTRATGTPTRPTSDSLFDPNYHVTVPLATKSIFQIKRWALTFKDSETTTGRRARNLVVNENKLQPGHSYMLALRVRDKEAKKGMASIIFKVNELPVNGRCSVFPLTGVELETAFIVRCLGWKDKLQPLGYEVSYSQRRASGPYRLLYTGSNNRISVILPSGPPQQDYKVYIMVSVYNNKGARVAVCPMTLTVKPAAFNNSATIEEILYNRTRNGNKLRVLQETGQDHRVKQTLVVSARMLNSLETVKNTTSRFFLRVKTRLFMLRVLQTLHIRDTASAIHSAEVLEDATRVPYELNYESLQLATGITEKINHQIQRFAKENQRLSDSVLELMTRLAANLITGATLLYDSYNKSSTANDTSSWKKIVLVPLNAVNDIAKLKISHTVLGESATVVNQSSVSVMAHLSSVTSSSSMTLHHATFTLPPNMDTHLRAAGAFPDDGCVSTMATVYGKNPYIWVDSQQHHSTVASLGLSTCQGQEIPVKNLSQDIMVTLPWREPKMLEDGQRATVEWQHLNVHTIDIRGKQNHSLHLHINVDSHITDGFVVQLMLRTSGNSSFSNFRLLKATSGESMDLFLAGEHLKEADSAIDVGVMLKNAEQSRIKKILSVTEVNYSFISHWIGCYYWNTSQDKWLGDGCRTTNQTTHHSVHCRCNHLTAFSGAIQLAPNPLHVKDLRKIESVSENPVTLVLVLCLIVLYFILLIFCARADKYDNRKQRIVHIAGVPSRMPQRYKITVETGHWFGSGTTANVVILLHGENHSSDPIELSAHNKPVFERASKDVFIFSSPESLSPVWKIHIWHYNEGKSPSWYLNRVIIKDLQTQQKWYFNCYRWLAVDEEDGQVDVELLATSADKSHSAVGFYYTCMRGLMDYHLWLSVLGRPSYSRFTRAQRLTCCLSLLLSYLAANAAWYKVNDKQHMVLGFLDLDWQTVVTGLISGMVALLPNLIWMWLFRFAMPPRFTRTEPTVKSLTNEAVTESTMLPNQLNGPTFLGDEDTLSILDQSIETLLQLRKISTKPNWRPSMLMPTSMDSIYEGFSGSESLLDSTEMKTSPDIYPDKPTDQYQLSYQTMSGCDGSSEHADSHVTQSVSRCCSVPHWCTSIAWIGCFATVLLAVSITVWYGLSFGYEKSIRWLQSLIFSIVESLLLSQPLAVLAVPLYIACSSRPASPSAPLGEPSDDAEVDEGFEDMQAPPFNCIVSSLEETSDRIRMSLAVRQHQRYLKFLRPPKKAMLYDSYVKRVQDRTVVEYICEMVSTLIFLVIVGSLVSGLWYPGTYSMNETIKQTITSNMLPSSNMRMDYWWSRKHAHVIDLLYWRPPGAARESPQIFLRGTQSFLVGKPRILYQHSFNKQICDHGRNISLHGVNSSRECWTTCDLQKHSWHSLELSRDRSHAHMDMKKMLRSLTPCIQQIIVQFSLFTPTNNMSSTVSWELTTSLVGELESRVTVHSFQSSYVKTALGVLCKICKVLFVVCYVYLVHHVLKAVRKSKVKLFFCFWSCLEVCLVVISTLSLAVYVRWSMAHYALYREVLTNLNDNAFEAGEVVHSSEGLLLYLYSLMVFLLMVRTLHAFRIFPFMKRLGYVLTLASRHLAGVAVMTVVYLLTFTHPGYLLFGRLHGAFRSFSSAFLTVSGMLRMRGTAVLENGFHRELPVASTVFVALYLLGVLVITRSLSASVVRWMYHYSKKLLDYDAANFLLDYGMSKLYSLKRPKTREETVFNEDSDEEEEDQKIVPVEYAVDEVETQMEELLFRMDNLVGAGNLEARLFEYSTDFLSSDEGEVEYLFRRDTSDALYCYNDDIYYHRDGVGDFYYHRDTNDDLYAASGYETDQSIQTYGSMPRFRDTQDDVPGFDSGALSNDVFFDESYSSLPTAPKTAATSLSNARHLREEGLWMHPLRSTHEPAAGLNKIPHTRRNSQGLASQSERSLSRRQSDPTKERAKGKRPALTRKPKIRPGESFLDDLARDECLSEETISIPDETRPDLSTYRTRNVEERKAIKKTKKRRGRGLGLFPVTAVSPGDEGEAIDRPPIQLQGFINHVALGEISSEDLERSARSQERLTGSEERWAETQETPVGSQERPSDQPREQSHAKVHDSRWAGHAPRGLIADISMNSLPQSRVPTDHDKPKGVNAWVP